MFLMTTQSTILIKQQNYGWSCTQLSGADRVFALKEQAIHFAKQQCLSVPAEIRIRERNGAERRMIIAPSKERRVIPFHSARAEDASRKRRVGAGATNEPAPPQQLERCRVLGADVFSRLY